MFDIAELQYRSILIYFSCFPARYIVTLMLDTKIYCFLLIRYCPRMRVAALGRLCQPRLLLSGWNSSGTLPRLCSEDGRKRAVDGHFLRLHSAILTSRRHNILQQLAKDGFFFLSNPASISESISNNSTDLLPPLQSEKARERVFREELSDSDKEPWVPDGSDLL